MDAAFQIDRTVTAAAANGASVADWAAVVAAVLAALATAFTAVVVTRLQARQDYRNALHEARLSAYQELFAILEPLALDGRASPDEQGKRGMATAMTSWYYNTGGLVMSRKLHKEFLELRNHLGGLESPRSLDVQLKDEDPDRGKASNFRTALTEEVLSREETPDRSKGSSPTQLS